MYKKLVKKRGRIYSYYYHNVREQGRIRNICLGKYVINNQIIKENPWVLKNRGVIHNKPEPLKLRNSKINSYLKLSNGEAGVAEAGNAPVLRTGTSQGTWVQNGAMEIPASVQILKNV